MPELIYLDNAATTPLHPSALEAMLPWLVGPAAGGAAGFGNPSATYGIGRAAWQAVDDARKTVAGVLGCRPVATTIVPRPGAWSALLR